MYICSMNATCGIRRLDGNSIAPVCSNRNLTIRGRTAVSDQEIKTDAKANCSR